MYFLVKWLCTTIVKSFFREVNILFPERIPIYGPVIFVGNHNNQFIDATMLIANLPRRVRFLIAEKSMKRSVIGSLARAAGCISVRRQTDLSFVGAGKVYFDDSSKQLKGIDTKFLMEVHSQDRVVVPYATMTIKEVLSDDTAILTDDPKSDGKCYISTPSSFKVLPKVDQTDVYDAVCESLKSGDTIGIFPEGGSHDRTTLLPLKPGVAVMAMSAILEGAEDVMIVPIGLTYHQPHKFQSRATVHVGEPISVSLETAEDFKINFREATNKILKDVEEGMRSCIITAQNHDTMAYIKLCCSIYPPERLTLARDKYYNLHQLFSKLFWERGDDPELQFLCDELKNYQYHLDSYGIPDHEVWLMKQSTTGATLTLMETVSALLLASILGLPVTPLWAPLRLTASYLAEHHRTQAVAASSVKVKGTDVVASYKVIVLLVLLPTVNMIYGLIFGLLFLHSLYQVLLSVAIALTTLPMLYYISMRHTEKILPLARRMKILLLVILGKVNIWRETERTLISHRTNLQLMVRCTLQRLAYEGGKEKALQSNVPKVVLDADTKRLIKKKKVPTATLR